MLLLAILLVSSVSAGRCDHPFRCTCCIEVAAITTAHTYHQRWFSNGASRPLLALYLPPITCSPIHSFSNSLHPMRSYWIRCTSIRAVTWYCVIWWSWFRRVMSTCLHVTCLHITLWSVALCWLWTREKIVSQFETVLIYSGATMEIS